MHAEAAELLRPPNDQAGATDRGPRHSKSNFRNEAEVLAYFKRIEEADALLKQLERKDLQLKLKMRLGQWVSIQHLIKEGAGFDDVLNQAYN